MLSIEVKDENCIKLIQIYQLLKKNDSLCKNFKFKAIIENNFSINYKFLCNSDMCCNKPQYSGNTVLHFLADTSHCNCKQCLDLFIKYDADFYIQNNNGCSPLLLAFQNNFKIDNLLLVYINKNNFTNLKDKNGISHFHVTCTTNHLEAIDNYLGTGISVDEHVNNDAPKYSGYTALHFAALHEQFETIELLLAHGASMNDKDAKGITPLHLLVQKCKKSSFVCKFFLKICPLSLLPDHIGLTNLHISCSINYVGLFKRFLNQDIDVDSHVKFDSPVWPGYTPLHVAVQFNLQTVILLLERGANILAKDASGKSSLDLCLKQFSLDKIIQILLMEKRHRLSQIKLADGTRLLDVMHAMKNINGFKQFIKTTIKNINTFVPLDSLIWPGYNLLHLAVMFDQSESSLISALLSYNIDFTMLNKHGMSPLHLAFYLNKSMIVEIILNVHDKILVDCVDQNNLSHLHIACSIQNSKIAKLFLSNGSDPNLATLKDFKCISDQTILYKTGTTPLDIALSFIQFEEEIPLSNVTFNLPDTKTYNPCKNVEEIITVSSTQGLSDNDYEENESVIIVDWMLKSEMKALVTNSISLKILQNLANRSKFNIIYKELFKRFINERRYEELGLTKLQIACASGDLSMVKEELETLESVEAVNQQISLDSKIWPGDTALHINSRRKEFPSCRSKIAIYKLLLAHGANSNLKNAQNLTPVHISNNSELEIAILLSSKVLFTANPVNNNGLSHFHLSCKINDFHIVEEFIKSGVNVNTPVNYFADLYAGYTPLHFAIRYGSKKVIELLLSHGADPNIKSADGLTPIYMAVSHKVYYDRIEALLRSPLVDIQSTDITGKSILIKALENISDSIYENNVELLDIIDERVIKLLLNKGACVKFANFIADEKCQLFIQTALRLSAETFQQLIKNIPDITDVDEKGQNIIHYVALYTLRSFSVFDNINMLVRNGCEINQKDNQGKTPLHKAVDRNSYVATRLLLSLGADIYIKNDIGKTPINYAFRKISKEPQLSDNLDLFEYIRHLNQTGLYMDKESIVYLKNDEFQNVPRPGYHVWRCRENLKEDKQKLDEQLKNEVSLSIDYFFSKQFEVDYRRMPVLKRQAICNICDSNNLSRKFPKLHSFIRLQFRKARSRVRLFESAINAFQLLLDRVIPEPCFESIFKYLHNDDLMNLVRSESGKLVFAPLREHY